MKYSFPKKSSSHKTLQITNPVVSKVKFLKTIGIICLIFSGIKAGCLKINFKT